MISGLRLCFSARSTPLLDVRDEDQRAHRRGEVVVRVPVGTHVLREILRLHELADVVKIRARPAHAGVRADAFGRRLGQPGHGLAVLVGAGRIQREPHEQRMIQVGQLQPGHRRGQLETSAPGLAAPRSRARR